MPLRTLSRAGRAAAVPKPLQMMTLMSPTAAAPLRALSTSARRALPTIHDIRAFAPGELEAARLDLSKALKLIPPFNDSTEPRRGELLRLLATTDLRLGNALDAEECLEDARDIEDRHLAMKGPLPDGGTARRETTFLLGVCYQKTGREDAAKDAFESVLKEDEGHWRARFHMGLLRIAEGEYADAEELIARVLEDEPTHEKATELMGMLKERRLATENKLEPPVASDGAVPSAPR